MCILRAELFWDNAPTKPILWEHSLSWKQEVGAYASLTRFDTILACDGQSARRSSSALLTLCALKYHIITINTESQTSGTYIASKSLQNANRATLYRHTGLILVEIQVTVKCTSYR